MNNFFPKAAFAATLLCAVTSTSARAEEMPVPAVCKTGGHQMSMDQAMDMSGMEMKEFQKEFMQGMQQMDPAMMQGVMHADADVAFICGMLAHHMGAISMAKVELKHGDDAEARALAQKIIEDQTREINQMTKWLAEKAK